MAASVGSWSTRPGVLRTLLGNVRLATRLLREPRVALIVKAVPIVALAYVISPFDFVPDVLPLVGELDDLAIVVIGLELFLWLCPRDAVSFHRAAIDSRRRYAPMPPPPDDYIDAEWHRA